MENKEEVLVWYKSKTVLTGIVAIILSGISLVTGAGATVGLEDAAIIVEAGIAALGAITILVNRILEHFKKKEA